jgi:hypothetical protein
MWSLVQRSRVVCEMYSLGMVKGRLTDFRPAWTRLVQILHDKVLISGAG